MSAATQSASESVEDFSEARGAERGVRLSEGRMVKDIEEFGAELETGLAEFGFLEHGEVHVAEVGPIDRVAAAIAERTSFRHREGRGIEPVGDGLWIGIWANASHAIRALVDEIAIPEVFVPM